MKGDYNGGYGAIDIMAPGEEMHRRRPRPGSSRGLPKLPRKRLAQQRVNAAAIAQIATDRMTLFVQSKNYPKKRVNASHQSCCLQQPSSHQHGKLEA